MRGRGAEEGAAVPSKQCRSAQSKEAERGRGPEGPLRCGDGGRIRAVINGTTPALHRRLLRQLWRQQPRRVMCADIKARLRLPLSAHYFSRAAVSSLTGSCGRHSLSHQVVVLININAMTGRSRGRDFYYDRRGRHPAGLMFHERWDEGGEVPEVDGSKKVMQQRQHRKRQRIIQEYAHEPPHESEGDRKIPIKEDTNRSSYQ